jgi:hypothetical protein
MSNRSYSDYISKRVAVYVITIFTVLVLRHLGVPSRVLAILIVALLLVWIFGPGMFRLWKRLRRRHPDEDTGEIQPRNPTL